MQWINSRVYEESKTLKSLQQLSTTKRDYFILIKLLCDENKLVLNKIKVVQSSDYIMIFIISDSIYYVNSKPFRQKKRFQTFRIHIDSRLLRHVLNRGFLGPSHVNIFTYISILGSPCLEIIRTIQEESHPIQSRSFKFPFNRSGFHLPITHMMEI